MTLGQLIEQACLASAARASEVERVGALTTADLGYVVQIERFAGVLRQEGIWCPRGVT